MCKLDHFSSMFIPCTQGALATIHKTPTMCSFMFSLILRKASWNRCESFRWQVWIECQKVWVSSLCMMSSDSSRNNTRQLSKESPVGIHYTTPFCHNPENLWQPQRYWTTVNIGGFVSETEVLPLCLQGNTKMRFWTLSLSVWLEVQ